MNYSSIYTSLIEKVSSQERVKLKKSEDGYQYYETHHIVPRAEGGSDTNENLILLTAREHYIAHLLLAKIYGGSQIYAYNLMANRTGCSHKYRLFREELADMVGNNTKSYIRTNGHPKGFKGKKHSEESKRMISEAGKGRTQSDNQRAQSSIRMKKNNPAKTDEVKQKLREAWVERRKTPVAEETRRKQSEQRRGTVCINKDGENKRIHPSELNNYLLTGWSKGIDRSNYKPQRHDHCKNRIWINKNGKSKMIYKEERESIYGDWSLGRAPKNSNPPS